VRSAINNRTLQRRPHSHRRTQMLTRRRTTCSACVWFALYGIRNERDSNDKETDARTTSLAPRQPRPCSAHKKYRQVTGTHRQRTTPPTPKHTHTTRTTPQTPKRTPPTNTSQRSEVARRRCVPPPTRRRTMRSACVWCALYSIRNEIKRIKRRQTHVLRV